MVKYKDMAIIAKRRKAYSVIYQKQNVEGKIQQVHETFYDYSQALKRKNQIESNSNQIEINMESTIIDFLNQYTSIVGFSEWSISRYESNIGIINNYLNPILKNKKIKDIDDNFAKWLMEEFNHAKAIGKRHQCADKTMPETMKYAAYTFLKKSFDYLVSNNFINVNGFHDISMSKAPSKNKSVEWNINILDQVLQNCERISIFLFVHLIFATGFNIKEVLALTWDDLSICDNQHIVKSNKIIERMNLNSIENMSKDNIIKKYASHGFNNTSTAIILYMKEKGIKQAVIHPKLYNLLMMWKKQQEKGINEQENQYGLIFTYFDGNPIDSRTMSKYYDQVIEQANLPKVTITTLKNYGISKRKNGKGTIAELYYDLYQTESLPVRKKTKEIHKKDIESLAFRSAKIKEFLPNPNMIDVSMLVENLKSNELLKQELIKQLKATEQ